MAVVADVAALAIVRGHDADPVERLGEVGQDGRDPVAREQVPLLRRVVVPDREDDEQRHHQQDGPQREFDIREEQDDRDDDHREALERELADAVLYQLLQVLDVTRHAAHEDAGLLFGEEVEAEALELREDPDAKVVHDARGELARDVDLLSLEVDADEREREVQRRADHDDAQALVALHPVTDGELGEQRTGLQGEADDDDEGGTGEDPLGIDA